MDETDIELLKELNGNSRATYRELADKLGLSINAVHKRVQAMVDSGVIQKFTIDLTYRALPWVQIGIKGVSEAGSIEDAVGRLGKSPNTWKIMVTGGNSLIITAILSNASEMSRYVSFAAREGKLKAPEVTVFNLPESEDAPGVPMTTTDYRIVAALLDNSRKQIVDLSTELGLSASTIRRRLERMEKNKLVRYGIDWEYASPAGIIVPMVMIKLKPGVDAHTAASRLKSKYSKSLLSCKTLDTHPNYIFVSIWTRTLNGIKELQDSLENEGLFEQVVPEIFFKSYAFDTWRTAYIRRKASPEG